MEDAEATLALVREAGPDNISVNRFIPLPGSPIFNELRVAGHLDLDWNRYSVGNNFNFTNMQDEQLNLYTELMYNSVHVHKITTLEKKGSLNGKAFNDEEVIAAKNQLLCEQHTVLGNLKREIVRLNIAWRESQEEIRRLSENMH